MNDEKEYIAKMNDLILQVVNEAAQDRNDKKEKTRLLFKALEVAQARNMRLDKSFDIMEKIF